MTEVIEKLEEQARKIAERENCVLYDLELVGQGGERVLRVFIDKEGAESVTIDDCSNVSRGLDLVLDVEDLVPGGAYSLEVSSPGLERRLRQPWHYQLALGSPIQVQLNAGVGEFVPSWPPKDFKRKKLTGELQEAGEDSIKVILQEKEPAKTEIEIPLQYIHKAKVLFIEKKNTKNPRSRKG